MQSSRWNCINFLENQVFFILQNQLAFTHQLNNMSHQDEETFHLVEETVEIYNKISIPYAEEQLNSSSNDWMFDLLQHRNRDDIVFDDPCPTNGFLLIYNKLWDGSEENIYLLAIINQRGIKSIRDLDDNHLPLLENILSSGSKVLQDKFGYSGSTLRVYFHYRPTYYHLHVHFNPINYDAPGINTEQAHLIQAVIANIRKNPNHYKEATLFYRLRRRHVLYKRLVEYGYQF